MICFTKAATYASLPSFVPVSEAVLFADAWLGLLVPSLSPGLPPRDD